MAGLLEYFVVTSSTFQSQLMVDVPITIYSAQQAKPDLCCISLIKSLNLAGLLEYLAAHH